MDKTNLNQIIGITLIFAILYYWAQINAPTEAQLAEQQRIRDSIVAANQESRQEPSWLLCSFSPSIDRCH